MTAWAEDYPYLTFETADGAKVSVSCSSLTITIEDGVLYAGEQAFTLTDLMSMYFSTADETPVMDIRGTDADDQSAVIYDLQGRKVAEGQMRRGIYVIKTQSGTRKVEAK